MDSYKIINADKLPLEVQNKFIPFLKTMLDIHTEHLISIFIYGSATGKNYIPKTSDINSVFVFKDLPFSSLTNSLKTVSKSIPKKIAAPLFLTREHIETSLDVFPIEFLDMKENHILMYGTDLLSDLKIKEEHIRLFCEQQIKGKLIRIRQAYLEVGLKKKGMEALLKESLNSLIPIFRNLLRLKGKKPPIEKEKIITQLCQEFDLDENVFLPIYKDTSNDEKIANQTVIIFIEKYLTQIKKLAVGVDQI